MSANKVQIQADGIVAEFPGYGRSFAALPSVPADGVKGYGHGCVLVNLGGTTTTDGIYVNNGTNLSCDFDAVAASVTALRSYPVPLTSLRVYDAIQTNLPGTPAADDLGLVVGAHGVAANFVKSEDFGGTTTAQYGRFLFPVPPTYVAGQAISLVVNAYMAVAADTSCDLTAYVYRASAPTTNICASGATNVNTLTTTNTVTFTITPTNVVVGDMLDVVLRIDGEDSGDAAPNIQMLMKSITMKFTTKEAA